MPPKASFEKTELVFKIYKYFEAESQRKAPFFSWNKINDRTIHALGISRSFLNKILKKKSVPVTDHKDKRNSRKESLDSFDRDLIRRVAVGFLSKNEFISIGKFRKRPCIKHF